METNYFGAVRCIKGVLPEMRERGSGCIVNVTSIGGKMAPSPFAPYVASKFALEALSESLAQEMKPFGVRVAIVEPGVIDTPMARRFGQLESPSKYPQGARWSAAFVASLKTPTAPSVVADKILEIVESDTLTLRHPAGPDAKPFLDWRGRDGGRSVHRVGGVERRRLVRAGRARIRLVGATGTVKYRVLSMGGHHGPSDCDFPEQA